MGDWAAAAAAVVYGAAMVVLLVLRSWQQRRATGSSGFHGFTGMASGGADRVAGVGFLAAVILGSGVAGAGGAAPAADLVAGRGRGGRRLGVGRVAGGRRRCRSGGGGAADDGRLVADRRRPGGADGAGHRRGVRAGPQSRSSPL